MKDTRGVLTMAIRANEYNTYNAYINTVDVLRFRRYIHLLVPQWGPRHELWHWYWSAERIKRDNLIPFM